MTYLVSTINLFVEIKCNVGKFAEEPEEELLEFELDPNMPYAELRSEIQSYFNISPEDPKVIKVRNKDYVLVPLTDMLTQSRDHR